MNNKYQMQRYAAVALFIFTVIVFFLMNVEVPFFSDDADCMYLFGHQISGFKGIIDTVVYDYNGINGRILCNAAALSSIMLGETAFNIINTIFFSAAIIFIFRSIKTEHPDRIFFLLSLTIIGLLSLSTGVDSMYYWASASSNYLWAIVFNLLFLFILDKFGSSEISIFRLLLLSILSFILALNNEALVCPIAGGLVVYYLFHRKQLNKNKAIIIAGYFIGMLIVAFAPGNYGRLSFPAAGLGFVGRAVKIFYFLRITYVMLLLLIVKVIKDRVETKNFIRKNALLFIVFAFSFFIPFISAASMRCVYGIEIFSLIILLRLVDSYNICARVSTLLATVASILFIAFYLCVLHESQIKWGIYRNVMQKYYGQNGNTVLFDDYQSRNALINYYTMSLDNIFMPQDKANQYALEKLRRRGIATNKEMLDSTVYIKIIAKNVYNMALKHEKAFFIPSNKIDGMGFYSEPSLAYSVIKYDSLRLDSINKGYMYADCSLSFNRNIHVRINYLCGDICFERAAFDVNTKYGRFILLNRKSKHYPFLRTERIALSKTLPAKKIEISMNASRE
jgi:hypothetical protein